MGPPGRGRQRRVGRADQDGLLPSRTQRFGSCALRLRGEAHAHPGGCDAKRHRQTPQAGPIGSGHQRRRASDFVLQLHQSHRRGSGRGPRARNVSWSRPAPRTLPLECPVDDARPARSSLAMSSHGNRCRSCDSSTHRHRSCPIFLRLGRVFAFAAVGPYRVSPSILKRFNSSIKVY